MTPATLRKPALKLAFPKPRAVFGPPRPPLPPAYCTVSEIVRKAEHKHVIRGEWLTVVPRPLGAPQNPQGAA